jgi:glycosyltransferase involved in cell wall biosynthesis
MSAAAGNPGPRLAYLTTRYPAVSHSFIQREVLALRELGAEVETLSLHAAIGSDLLTAADREEAVRTFAVSSRSKAAVAADHLATLARHPAAYLRTLRFALGRPGPDGRRLSSAMHFAAAVVVWRRCRRRRLDHLHAHFTSPAAAVAWLAGRLGEEAGSLGPSWSFTAHGTDIAGDSPARLAEKVRDADLVVCVSECGRSQLLRLAGEGARERTRVVRCGLDAAWRQAGAAAGSGAGRTDRLRLLAVGRLEEEKGHRYLLEAVAALGERGEEVELELVGDGSARGRLTEQARRLGIADRVEFRGSVGQDLLHRHYAAADVFCLPSLGEGVPVVLMEAMAMGLPVVATRVGGVPELVGDGAHGILVAPTEVGELVEAIAALGADAAARRRLGAAGRERVLAEFDAVRSARLLERELGKAAGRRRARAAASAVDVCVVPGDAGNPYQQLLAAALAEHGAKTRMSSRLRLADVLAGGRTRVIHLHWIEFITHSTAVGRGAGPKALARASHFLVLLALARLRGIRIVWTVHNLEPHEARRRWIDRPLSGLVARLSDSVLAHSHNCAAQVSGRLRRPDVEVAYHGNYAGVYPPPQREREEIRRALGLPADAYVVLAFGLVRPYKQIASLIAEVRALADQQVHLLVAGRPLDEAMRQEVERAAGADPRIVLRLERIPDREVAELHRAADVAALAYRDVFSSGALMLALSCSLPVIAPAGGTAEELGVPPGIRCYEEGGLGTALAASRSLGNGGGAAAAAIAAEYSWEPVARAVLGAGR